MTHSVFFRFRVWMLLGLALTLSACAGYSGSDLTPGQSMLPDIVASMGEPAMRWKEADGREQLAYPRGPLGTQTFMVFVKPDGRLDRIEKVLNYEHFSRIEGGKTDMAAVLKLLGPVFPQNVTYFKARDELVWSWLFCDSYSMQSYFDVLFDGQTGVVRTTQQRQLLGPWDGMAGCGQ